MLFERQKYSKLCCYTLLYCENCIFLSIFYSSKSSEYSDYSDYSDYSSIQSIQTTQIIQITQIIRVFRVFRVFRLFEYSEYSEYSDYSDKNLKNSKESRNRLLLLPRLLGKYDGFQVLSLSPGGIFCRSYDFFLCQLPWGGGDVAQVELILAIILLRDAVLFWQYRFW